MNNILRFGNNLDGVPPFAPPRRDLRQRCDVWTPTSVGVTSPTVIPA